MPHVFFFFFSKQHMPEHKKTFVIIFIFLRLPILFVMGSTRLTNHNDEHK